MKRVQNVIDQDLFVVVAHTSAGDFQVRGDPHRFIDREKRVKVIFL